MEHLDELLSTQRDHIIQTWTQRIRGTLSPASLPQAELEDEVPFFLDEIAAALRRGRGLPAAASPESSPTAREHGGQRLRLGFNLYSVVREYGELHGCIVGFAHAAGVRITEREYHTLFECMVTGIADSVSAYARERDADLQRQATEHFAFVAHELRNPLTSAKLSLMALQRKGLLPEGKASESLQRGLGRMQHLIEQSLRVMRLGAAVELRRQRLSLGSVLRDVQAGAEVQAEEQGVRLEVSVPEDAEVYADPRLLFSAVSNLLQNAIKFTHAGGTVCLRGQISGGRVLIEVEDECGGLPPGSVEKAFNPFVQLEEDPQGFGLGLAIAKQAAEAHGGVVRVQDLPGKGCIFVLELPAEG